MQPMRQVIKYMVYCCQIQHFHNEMNLCFSDEVVQWRPSNQWVTHRETIEKIKLLLVLICCFRSC